MTRSYQDILRKWKGKETGPAPPQGQRGQARKYIHVSILWSVSPQKLQFAASMALLVCIACWDKHTLAFLLVKSKQYISNGRKHYMNSFLLHKIALLPSRISLKLFWRVAPKYSKNILHMNSLNYVISLKTFLVFIGLSSLIFRVPVLRIVSYLSRKIESSNWTVLLSFECA